MEKVKVYNQGSGWIWFVGWLFTVGYLHLASWKIAYALVLWPYYLGQALGA